MFLNAIVSSSHSSTTAEYCSNENDSDRQHHAAPGTAEVIQTIPVTLGASVTRPQLKGNTTALSSSNRHFKQCSITHYHKLPQFHYYLTRLLLLVTLMATPLRATDSDSILLSISTQDKIPDTTATAGKLFIFEIPSGAHNGKNITDIKVRY